MNTYIPAGELKAEIERRIKLNQMMMEKDSRPSDYGRIEEGRYILRFVERLQQEQPTRGYDEAYLNECIAKASKTWKGVDVDKYMDEIRGREQEQPDAKLDDSIVNEWASRFSPEIRDSIKSTAYHFWDMAREGLR